MNRHEATWLERIRRRNDGVQRETVLVACSGGGDSTALLVFLWRIRHHLDLELVVAHADHGIRTESAEDAAFVRELCRQLDVDLVEAWLDVPAHASQQGCGLETAARELRWAWLGTEALSCGAKVVATGHTLDDHSETVLMRLLRNGGSGALTPLPPRQGLRWSPLVETSRNDLRAYLRKLGLSWREDASNLEGFTPRNRLRPWLEQLRQEAPALDRHLWETHQQVRELSALRLRVAEAWRGARWDVEPEPAPSLLLAPQQTPDDLLTLLPVAFQALDWAAEAATLRDLAPWLAKILNQRSRAPKTWGGWSLKVHPRRDGSHPWRALMPPQHPSFRDASNEQDRSSPLGGTLEDFNRPQEAP